MIATVSLSSIFCGVIMLDIWELEKGMKVESMPDGRVGTVIDWEPTSIMLSCGCCSDIGPNLVTLTWDDECEWDIVDADELRLKA